MLCYFGYKYNDSKNAVDDVGQNRSSLSAILNLALLCFSKKKQVKVKKQVVYKKSCIIHSYFTGIE